MAETDFTSVYRQFFEEFAKTLEVEDDVPIRVASYSLSLNEITGELIESCSQYLNEKKCPQSLLVPLTRIAIEEIKSDLKRQNLQIDNVSKVMHLCISKLNEICLQYTDNEKLSNLPPPDKEPFISYHAIKHKRRNMEDRLTCLPRFNTLYNIKSNSEAGYYGIFDGHNGSEVASFAVSHLHQFLAESQYYPDEPVLALREAYAKTESCCIFKQLKSGTTAIAILHQPVEKKLFVSWLGDSQALLVTEEGYLMLIDPHKPERRDESSRIYRNGGFVVDVHGSFRVNGHLAVSRAIGDEQYKPIVSAEPDIRVINLTGSEEFLVIGCDGLWDVVEPREVIEAVYFQIREKPDNIESVSRRLVELAKENNSSDNISVIVVFFAEPSEISKRSVENRGPWPEIHCQDGVIMETDFQTTEKPLFLALSDQKLNRIYEENGRHEDFMDNLKEDSDEDFGPETDVDAIDDILVSPTKSINPFSNDIKKREVTDCDESHNLIDCSNQEIQNMDKDTVNINRLLKGSSEDISTGNLTVEENVDKPQMMNPVNSYPLDFTDTVLGVHGINFSNFNSNNNELLKEIKLNADAENPSNQDLNDDSTCKILNENAFIIDDEHSETEECVNNITNESAILDEKATENEIDKDEPEKNEILCNGVLEVHNLDKKDLEKPISSIPDETNKISKLDEGNMEENLTTEISNITEESKNLPFESNDEFNADRFVVEELREISPKETSENEVSSIADSTSDLNILPPFSGFKTTCSKNSEIEEGEVTSPSSTHLDEKVKDEIVAESGGEVDSEDDEWNYYKVESGAPAQERVDLVAIPVEVPETEKPIMTTPLNPDAAEFIPVSPVANTVDNDINKTPINRSVSRGLNDIIASSPNWNDMDHVEVPDETSFLTEVKSRPSNIFTENDLFLDNSGELGCTDLKHDVKDIAPAPDVYKSGIIGESLITENIPESNVSPIHGIALANDMTSSFIDPSTITSDKEIINKEVKSVVQDEAPFNLEDQSVLNVSTPEFKSELVDHISDESQKLPDLLSPVSSQMAKPKDETLMNIANQMSELQLEKDILDISQSPSCVKDSPVIDKNSEIKSLSSVLSQVSDTLLLEKQNFVTNDILAETDKISVNEPIETSKNAPLVDSPSGAVVSKEIIPEKIDSAKKVTATPKTAPGKIMKTTAATKTPPSVTKSLSAVKRQTPTQTTKSIASKPINNAITSATSIKPAPMKVTTTSKTSTAKPLISTAAQRPSARPKSTTTVTKSTTNTTTATAAAVVKAPTSKLSPTKTTISSRVTSTTNAPKPKPRVPSIPTEKKSTLDGDSKASVKRTELVGKKPGATYTVSTTTRTVTSRPMSVPTKPAVIKSRTTETSTRTTSAKPRTVTSMTVTTTTTRTVLNSKKPLAVGDKSSKVLNKSLTKTVNGLANGKVDTTSNKTKKTSAITSTISKAKIENKTETKAENISVETIQNDVKNSVIENTTGVNLINGIINE